MFIQATKLPEILIITPQIHQDHRGFFIESYNKGRMSMEGVHYEFVQDNHSLSVESGTLRGLHYQLNPYAQTKLIRVIAGAIYDVAVDIRRDSPTYGQWVGVILSDTNHRQLLVPHGFAHGFCTLTANTQVIYKVDQYYSSKYDRGIAWNDPELNIDWPVTDPILSEKDSNQPYLQNAEIFDGR